MHEVSLAVSILDIIEEYAAKTGFNNVNSIRLSFGRLTCIEPKTLAFAFKVQSEGTRADGAKLVFEVLPIEIHCLSCGSDSQLELYSGTCPKCGQTEILVTGGKQDLKMIDMEVD
jgi:hydrogenase nickel incorporation protein HypA/HybF